MSRLLLLKLDFNALVYSTLLCQLTTLLQFMASRSLLRGLCASTLAFSSEHMNGHTHVEAQLLDGHTYPHR